MPHDHDDFAMEPVRGLPEQPPEGETILWQGAPNGWALAKEALMIRWVMGYFVLLGAWRFGTVVDLVGWGEALRVSSPFLILGLIVCTVLIIIAYVMAKATVYTVTNRRIAMRIGAALTVTLNLPYQWIASADLKRGGGGTGTIALTLLGDTQLSYLVCWPHVRPWRLAKMQPALRCIPEADRVAELISLNARTRVEEVLSQRQSSTDSATVAAE
ncbi:MAG: photosynthetic complex putative assembly protein PuhB [Pseudomonadota bacterium]